MSAGTVDRSPRAQGRTGPTRIDDATRAQVVELARSGMPRNEVARRTGVGSGSVSRICSAAGITFARAGTQQATEAKRVDQGARRTALAGSLLDDLEAARRWLADASDARELRDAANAVQSLAGAHARLATVPVSKDDQTDQAKSLLGQIAIGLQLVHGSGEAS